MTDPAWHPIRGVEPARLAAARLQAHHAVQWLARTARAYIPKRSDDRHTNLGWDDHFKGFFTHLLPDGARLGLRIGDLALVFFDTSGAPKETLVLDGRSDAEAREWLGRNVQAHGFDPSALDAPLPYALPARTGGETYGAAALAEPLGELATWYSNANLELGTVPRHVAKYGLGAPPVHGWPHHFDLDTLVTVAPGRTTGIGFSPGDEFYDEPYFYVSLHPAPDIATLPALPAIGHWHAKGFTAAVAPAHRILAAKDQGGEVAAFLHVATEITIAALRRK
ncbi:MAG TPA: hypothetical protein VGH49_17780 [Xanthobacteraceae bacterium]